MRHWKFRCLTESSAGAVKLLLQSINCGFDNILISLKLARLFFAFQNLSYLTCRIKELVTLSFPHLSDCVQNIGKARHTETGMNREIRPRKERLLVPCHNNAHRPASAACKRLTNVHIHAVDVGTLLPVNLY